MTGTHSQQRRLWSETVTVLLENSTGAGTHAFDVSLVYDGPASDSGLPVRDRHASRLHEIVFVGRGKIGQGLDQMLVDLGVKLSRVIQGRDPVTGQDRD